MGDAAGPTVAGLKKAKARGSGSDAAADSGFKSRVIDRLNAENTRDDVWKYLVLGALDSDQDLAAAISGDALEIKLKAQTKPRQAPRVAYLKSITVEGFRGIGKPATLDLPPGPGLTLVVGRNGSGKSSFAEALELLLTGDTFRWKGKRSKVWQRGLAQPPPPDGGDRGRVRRRGREGAAHHQRAMGGRGRPRRRRDHRADPRQAEDRPRSARLDGAARQLPALPFLQRARLDARRGPVEAVRRAGLDPRPRRAGRRAGAAGRGAQAPREGAEGSGRHARQHPPPPAADRRRPRASC